MPQRTIIESVSSPLRLSFNIQEIDKLFPCFTPGNFALLYGSPTVVFLSMLLCVRAQLPHQLGGLETNVVLVDGGNTFRLYTVSAIAQLHELDPRKVLERILISRAFTAYQMTSLIFDRLQNTVEKYDSKLVILSDIARLYLDKSVPKREAKEVFNNLATYISNLAQKKHVIIIATYPPHHLSRHNTFFREVICGRANVVISVNASNGQEPEQQFILEKHPFLHLGRTIFPSENLELLNYTEA